MITAARPIQRRVSERIGATITKTIHRSGIVQKLSLNRTTYHTFVANARLAPGRMMQKLVRVQAAPQQTRSYEQVASKSLSGNVGGWVASRSNYLAIGSIAGIAALFVYGNVASAEASHAITSPPLADNALNNYFGIQQQDYTNYEYEREGRFAPYVKERLKSTYMYLLAGLTVTAASAATVLKIPAATSFAARHPIIFMIGGSVAVMGGFMGARASQDNTNKHMFWLAAVTAMGALLSPFSVLGGQILLNAAAGTGVIVGTLSGIAYAAPDEKFLNMGGALGIGLAGVFAASLGSMFFPQSQLLYGVWLYGGLALFGGFMLYDTHRIIKNAKQDYGKPYSPIDNSIGIYLNTVQIFIRLATIMAGNRRR